MRDWVLAAACTSCGALGGLIALSLTVRDFRDILRAELRKALRDD